MRRRLLLTLPVLVAVGLLTEAQAFSVGDPRSWVPDLAVGLAFAGAGTVVLADRTARPGAAGSAVLLIATGSAWLAANLGGVPLQLYRGPLAHLLVAYPGARPRSTLDRIAVVTAYIAAIAPVWNREATAVAYPIVLAAVVLRSAAASRGPLRRDRLTALRATAALTVALVGGSVARSSLAAGTAVEPALLVLELVLVAVAIGLGVRLCSPQEEAVADLVVELGEAPGPTLREGLARALGDPALSVGYWSPEAACYIDESGAVLELPAPGAGRIATVIERDGAPLAVLLHDRAVLATPALAEAVATSSQLVEANAALRAEVQGQLAELAGSRRRLLLAADEERRALEERLEHGAGRRLERLAAELEQVPPGYVGRATDQLRRAREELRQLALGLHPRELAESGLSGALQALAETAPVPVDLRVAGGRVDPQREATAYFVCAEALANVVKHAGATTVGIDVDVVGGRLVVVVADDGVGGADAAAGSGLQGLEDRVAALGGVLAVSSPSGHGTRLVAEIPPPGAASA